MDGTSAEGAAVNVAGFRSQPEVWPTSGKTSTEEADGNASMAIIWTKPIVIARLKHRLQEKECREQGGKTSNEKQQMKTGSKSPLTGFGSEFDGSG
ncbi:hypothetical protein BSKO_11829 [Bryopsis sp. KO-2023]|nr:hypothetical protein BSKO_11829 [Bryopsis sp. KO-2023]